MKNKQELEKKADQTLNSLNNLQQLEANEFLHAKILHRIESKKAPNNMVYNKIMVRVAAVLCLLVCLNGISFYVLKQKNAIVISNKSAGANVFADAYGLNNNLNSY